MPRSAARFSSFWRCHVRRRGGDGNKMGVQQTDAYIGYGLRSSNLNLSYILGRYIPINNKPTTLLLVEIPGALVDTRVDSRSLPHKEVAKRCRNAEGICALGWGSRFRIAHKQCEMVRPESVGWGFDGAGGQTRYWRW